MCGRRLIAVLFVIAWCGLAHAEKVMTVERVASGFEEPTFLCSDPNDASRLFVLERNTGNIKLIKNGVVQSKPFLSLEGKLCPEPGEEVGLFSMAFPPDFGPDNKYFYVCYSAFNCSWVIEAYKVGANPDRAKKGSGKLLLSADFPEHFHYGGMIAFGPDGYLYASRGDSGPQEDPFGHGQDLDLLLGKLLRIEVNKDKPYKIPPTNPFVNQVNKKPEIWAYGLRNPWRFSFDRLTGDVYIGDVGQDTIEEISFQPASSSGGENYGWNIAEGFECLGGGGTCGSNAGFTPPIHQYVHNPGGTAVIGGYVYRGSAIPKMQGRYFFADHSFSTIWSLKHNGTSVTNLRDHTKELEPSGPNTINLISSFGEDADGELYIVDSGDGEIYKIVPRP